MALTTQDIHEFLSCSPISEFMKMYDVLPDVLFWIKNHHGQIMHANKFFLEHIGVRTLEQALGLTDYDFAPRQLAKQYVEDDKRVLKGELVTDRLEMNSVGSGDMAWFTTTKRPLLNSGGDIIGSYGITRHLEKTSIALSGIEALKTPVNYIRKNYMRPISLGVLADVSHLSISALERRFKKFLSKTPKQYIIDVRLEHARRLLVETTLPIALVAEQSGFVDASYFSRRFKRKFALLPSEFRAEHRAD
jgi:AraC-like DNA-binding protein